MDLPSGESFEVQLAAARKELEADPDDPELLRFVALHSERSSEPRNRVEEFAWRFVRAWPTSHEPYALLGRLYADTPRGEGFSVLAREKLHFDPEAAEEEEIEAPDDVPEQAADELEPHLLLHRLQVAGMDEVEREVVDRVLARARDCEPLLRGAARCYADELIDMDGAPLAARALALLGEIGDPAALPFLAPYLGMEDDAVADGAGWAFRRISRRRPAETLHAIGRMTRDGEPWILADLAQQIALMPEAPGRKEALLALGARMTEFDEEGREVVTASMITAGLLIEGKNSPLAARIRQEHGAAISREMESDLRRIAKELGDSDAAVEDEPPTVYDIVCTGFDFEDGNEPYVRELPKIGRNDPCWCGSGKKYKKCHLASDEAGA